MSRSKQLSALAALPLAAVIAALALIACTPEPEEVTVEVPVVETVVVDRELQVEVRVVETVLVDRDVPRTVIVPVTVVVERTVVVPTALVERERTVPVTVVVEQTRVVERERIVRETVVVEATPEPTVETFYGASVPVAEPTTSEPPRPRTGSDTVVIRTGDQIRGSGVPGDEFEGLWTHPPGLDPGSPNGGMFTNASVTEKFFLTDAGGNAVNQVIEGWRLVSDRNAIGGQALIFDLKRNVPFHDQWGSFGDLTADDVAWSFNLGNPGYSPEAFQRRLSWEWSVGNQPVTIVDRHTVRVPIDRFDASWDTHLFGQSGVKLSITSKRAYEEMGEDWAREHVVGTGPYRVKDYAFDDLLQLEAVQNHHRITPAVENVIYQSIYRDEVAVAALRSGRVDVAVVWSDYYPSLTEEGFELVGAGAGRFQSIVFPGNYWQDSIYTDDPNDVEEPINQGVVYSHYWHPWIGDPGDPDDVGTPEGLTSMERAALVRRALSHAIDREGIAEVLFSNSAWVNYIHSHDANNPNYQSRWEVQYDPALAEELLDRAGYPRKDYLEPAGTRFDMPLFSGDRRDAEEIGVAVAGMWRAIGINVHAWMSDYDLYETSLINRTATIPFVDSGGYDGPHTPWDWPFYTSEWCSSGRSDTFHLEVPYRNNLGVEVRELCEWGTEMRDEQDKSRRLAIRDEIADFLFEWNLAIGVVATGNVAVVNPKKIASWDMPMSVRGAAIHHPEFLVTVR